MTEKVSVLKRRILNQLYYNQSLSCADIGYLINKSISSTTKLLNELMAEGIVIETGYAPSSGGRRPVTYSIKPDAGYIVAVAMDQLVTRIVIMDMHNQNCTPVENVELPLSNNPNALSVLTQEILGVIEESGVPKAKIAGIGIGMPGFIDGKKGINYSFLSAPGSTIIDYITEKTGIHTFIDNDSSLIALAELRFGAARNRKNAMVINMGWGVGLGLILNGELFRGHDGFAGEFSHIPLFTNNRLCSCGKHGCLETETSLLVIAQKAQAGIEKGQTSVLKNLDKVPYEQMYKVIMDAVKGGDRFAVELLSEAGYNIGRGVAILIHILNPEVIILSGRASAVGKIWQPPIQQALNENCIPRLASNTDIEISPLGYRAELIGSAALVMENFGKEMIKRFNLEPSLSGN